MRIKLAILLLCFALLLYGCKAADGNQDIMTTGFGQGINGDFAGFGDDSKAFGEPVEDIGVYDGYFEGESADISVECISGTKNAFILDGTTLTFTAIEEETEYSISGTFRGNIIIDTGDEYKFSLEMHGFSIVCDSINPILVKSGDEVSLKAKNDTVNYIYDIRDAVDSADDTLFSGAIHSEVDLEIGGKGELTVVSENNNGIHSKDDLQVKNLTLAVVCIDNALKGNDSVELESCNTTLIASAGDCIKTSNSDISEKGNQRGCVTVTGGTHTLYAACDGIDAAYNVIVDDSTAVMNIYTDKYSNYSDVVTANSTDANYIRFTSDQYHYSVKYYNSDTDCVWVNAEYHSTVSGGRTMYYYYSYPKVSDYAKQQFFIYENESQLGQENEYLLKSDFLTVNGGYDTFALTSSYDGLSYQWTNYTTQVIESGYFGPGGRPGGHGGAPGGGGGAPSGMGGGGGGVPGGMGGGNTDKSEYSCKGIKAANEIIINAGTVNIKSYDDAIHANNDTVLENGTSPLGNVTVNGGTVTVYSNDDGIHADGVLNIQSGTVNVTNSYEGLEGASVNISDGFISVVSKDDGINATATSGTAVSVSGGTLYVYCMGDGIDSNSRTADVGIVFYGGKTAIITNSPMNSAIDTENGYTYTAGSVIAVMPCGGMLNEATHCSNFSSIGHSESISISKDSFLTADIGAYSVTLRSPVTADAIVIILGDTSPTVKTETSTALTLDINGVAWTQ